MTDELRGLGFACLLHTANDLRGMAIRRLGLTPISSGTTRSVLPLRRAYLLMETLALLGLEGEISRGHDTLDAPGRIPGAAIPNIARPSPPRGQASNV